jgi:aryl carrier-like protein
MEDIEAINKKSHNVVLDILPYVTSNELLDDTDLFSLGLDSVNAITLVLSLKTHLALISTPMKLACKIFVL